MTAQDRVYGFCPSCGYDAQLGTPAERILNVRADGTTTCKACRKTTPSSTWLRVKFPAGLCDTEDESKDRSKMN